MNKKLTEQLHNLQNYKPDPVWKQANRNLLLSQISASSVSDDSTQKTKFFGFSFIKSMPQPLTATFLILAILLGAGTMSLNASKDAIPGDSLYIAKKLNEKAKLAITFNEKKKTKLGLENAQERVKEIQEILRVNTNNEEEETVNSLVDEVRKEIQIAKSRMNVVEQVDNEIEKQEDATETNPVEKDVLAEADDNNSDDSIVFIAGLEKEDKGLQVSGLDEEKEEEVKLPEEDVEKTDDEKVEEVEKIDSASSSEDALVTNNDSATSSETSENSDDEGILKTIDELVTELENTIGQIDDKGTVEGVSEEASSTEEALDI